MQDHLVVRSEAQSRSPSRSGSRWARTSPTSSRSRSTTSRSAIRRRLARAAAAAARFDPAANQLVLEEADDGGAKTQVLFSQPGVVSDSCVRFALGLAARAWELRVDVVPSLSGDEQPRHAVEHRFGEEREHVRESLSAWHLRVPRLRTTATTCATRSPSRRRPGGVAAADGRQDRDAAAAECPGS